MKPNELILLIEDDDATGKLLSISLHEYGYRTRLAKDITSAKREFITQNPALLILDLVIYLYQEVEINIEIRKKI